MFGRVARLPIDINSGNENPETRLRKYEELNDNFDALETDRKDTEINIKCNIEKAQKKQKEHYDKIHGGASYFDVGCLVLKKDFTRKKRKGGKLDYRWTGPYIIISSLGKGLYKLKECRNDNVGDSCS